MSGPRSGLVETHYEKLAHLAGPQTPIRVAVLAELCANESLRQRELLDIFVKGKDEDGGWDFDVSKPTLYRQLDERPQKSTGDTLSLVERGWVEDVSERRGDESRYSVTPKGRLLYDEIESLFGLFDLVEEVPSDLEPFLEVVTMSDTEMERDVLEGLIDAEIYTKTPTGLDETTTKALQFVAEGSYHRGISWIASGDYVDFYLMFTKELDNEAEFIFTRDVLDGLVENHTEKWGEILETGNVTLFEYDVFPLGLTIVEQGVAWGYFEPPEGTHKAELVTESDEVREWAIDVFERYKQEGRNVTEEQLKKTTQ
ncbi:MAG: hypothetical protein U5J64_07165 [Halobacteriales archaeon]|nr:hypothetical protein [Halobacteriales archaeon]